ncbi:type IV toxin-antitoxin system AbiEi family antitoxin domain-containing protein [Streptosporangium sp. NPDC049376]|uniref:type IV toxin-antitoxin system AbiEi family antitoxin domain-containing protein n=1 Tax=Streptosporangium sp. NPDC049376 TaxID=3366192 RepID=UPI003788E76E
MMWEERFAELSAVAARQNGMVTAAQAARVGVDDRGLAHFAASGLLVELDWSVYQLAWSSTGPRYAYPYAAWLALLPELYRWERPRSADEDAVLSHESACRLLGLGSVASPLMIFTSPETLEAPRAVKIHLARLTPEEVTVVEGIPVTTAHRTVVDLVADWTDHGDLRRVLMDAVLKDLVDLRALHADLAPLAERHEFPGDGARFVEYFIPDLDPAALSPRNRRGHAALVHPERIAAVEPRVAHMLTEAGAVPDETLSRDIAAEIISRVG